MTAINPLTSALLGSIVLHEEFGITSLVGAALILTGLIIHHTTTKDSQLSATS